MLRLRVIRVILRQCYRHISRITVEGTLNPPFSARTQWRGSAQISNAGSGPPTLRQLLWHPVHALDLSLHLVWRIGHVYTLGPWETDLADTPHVYTSGPCETDLAGSSLQLKVDLKVELQGSERLGKSEKLGGNSIL